MCPQHDAPCASSTESSNAPRSQDSELTSARDASWTWTELLASLSSTGSRLVDGLSLLCLFQAKLVDNTAELVTLGEELQKISLLLAELRAELARLPEAVRSTRSPLPPRT